MNQFMLCQRCEHWNQVYPDQRRYFMTGCGRIFCETCLKSIGNKCPNCPGHCGLAEMNENSSAALKSYFMDPLPIMSNSLKTPLRILQFQSSLQKNSNRVLKKILNSCNEVKKENISLRNEHNRLKSEQMKLLTQNESLKQQNEVLKRKVAGIGKTRTATSFSVGSKNSQQSNHVDRFREPPQRPNAYVQPINKCTQGERSPTPMHTSSSSSPASPMVSSGPFSPFPSTPSFRQGSQGFPATNTPRVSALFSGGFQSNVQQQLTSPGLFRTSPGSTQGSQCSTISEFSSGYQSQASLTNRLYSADSGIISSRTPELISRLRNLKWRIGIKSPNYLVKMADYWKSLEKKFCDICKCWLADNKASIEFHENGKRHKENVQKRLKDIQKKNKQDEKKEKKLEYDMKMIEQAAQTAMKKDMEDNPDMSMKLQAYYEKVGGDSSLTVDADDSKNSSSNTPKISHRSEKEKKSDEAKLAKLHKPAQPYHRSGGWHTVQTESNYDLELPSSSSHQFVAKEVPKRKPEITFGEKSVSSLNANSVSTTSSFTGFMPVKPEPEVAFKKRRVDKSNMRRRDDD